jgi:hypothetical protein
LAEDLCSKAKEKARAQEGTSWIDFHNVYGGFSAGLNEVRELQYRVGKVSLHDGPYILGQTEHYRSIENFKKGLCLISDKDRWPLSKVKDMRSALAKGEAAARRFFEEANARGLELPLTTGEVGKAPDTAVLGMIFDMTDMLENYPSCLL